MRKADFGILGMGLAGAVLAHELLARRRSVAFADETRPAAASPIAPGLVNPLAGRKLKPDPLLPFWMQALETARSDWQATYGQSFWHPTRMVRLLESPSQAARLEAIDADPELRGWVAERFAPGSHGPLIRDEHGSFLTTGSGWLDIPRLVHAVQHDPRLLSVSCEELPQCAHRLIDCRGWRTALSPRWSHLPWNCARGEMMTVELSTDLPTRVWNRGAWIQPLGGRRWRVGATYEWDLEAFPDPPTPAGASFGSSPEVAARPVSHSRTERRRARRGPRLPSRPRTRGR